MTTIAYPRGAELDRAPASPRDDTAAAYMVLHPMGALRLVTPAEYEALERQAREQRASREVAP